MDFEAIEFFVRGAVLELGCGILEKALEGVGSGRRGEALLCPDCQTRMHSEGLRKKTIRTILGPVRFRRSLFTCPVCGRARTPGDEILGCQGTGFSPGARRMMARSGSREAFKEAARDLELYAKLAVDPKDIERVAEDEGRAMARWMDEEEGRARSYEACGRTPPEAPETTEKLYISFDGTGVPMRPSEVAGRKGKQSDGRAKTREVKLGCVFTQSTLDEKGRPVRDPDSTTYIGAIENSTEFGYRIRGEAIRRGLRGASAVTVLTDGAAYNRTIAKEHFPKATYIIDLYHAREHLERAMKLFGPQQADSKLEDTLCALLEAGQIETLIGEIRKHLPRNGPRRRDGLKEIGYFENNTEEMRYADFRAQGLFVGSGVVEAGCKTLIGKRLKNSGMFWTLAGANAIIASRCCQYSRRFEQYWEDRTPTEATG